MVTVLRQSLSHDVGTRSVPLAPPITHRQMAHVSRDKKSKPHTALRRPTRLRTAPETVFANA